MRQQTQTLLEEPAPKSPRFGKRELLHEGEGKNLYNSDKPELIIQEFRQFDHEDGENDTRSTELCTLRNQISSYLFKYLEGFHIPTHFISRISDTEMLVRRLEVIPLTLKIYNVAGGTLTKRLGLKEDVALEFPVIEHYHKKGERGVSWVNEYHIYAFSIATPEELKQLNRIASKVNAVLRGLCDRRGLMLAELQIEFGRYKGQIALADELSPVTCRFWDMSVENKNGRDRFLPGQERVEEAYALLRDRLELKL
jgi:phosphoribosylaminoimidazole-succinocarboxamide synthase